MNILLIYPVPPRQHWPRGLFRSRWVPSGVAYLAAALKRAGHDVRVHVREEQLVKNGCDWDDADAQVRSLLTDYRPDMVGFSVTTPAVTETQTIAQWAKTLLGQRVLTVAGGPHPTAVPEWTLRDCPAVDVVCVGEAEQTLVALAELGPRTDVSGIVYRDGESFVQTAPRTPPPDLDSLGPVPYELFDMGHYTARHRWMIRWLNLSATNIRTSRGCPNRCRFCAGHVVSGLGVRTHSVDYVLDQVRYAIETLGVEAIHFEDDTMGFDADRLRRICDGVAGLGRKTRWECCLRVDQVDPELLQHMRRSGCIQIEYGFECGSDRSLQSLGKRTTAEMNERAARLTHEAGIRIFADIMVGLPGETQQDVKATVRFLGNAKPEIVSATRLYPLPGTAIFNSLPDAVRENINWGSYSYFDMRDLPLNLTAMPDAKAETVIRRFSKYVTRPWSNYALLRDTPTEDRPMRKRLRKPLVRFAIRHPIRALRLAGMVRSPRRRGL